MGEGADWAVLAAEVRYSHAVIPTCGAPPPFTTSDPPQHTQARPVSPQSTHTAQRREGGYRKREEKTL